MNAFNSKADQRKSDQLFTFASGGWIVLLTALGCLLLVAWAMRGAILRWTGAIDRPPGDRQTIESYAFDLSNLAVPRELIVPAMMHRDMVPTMDLPTHSGPSGDVPVDQRWVAMQRQNDPKYGKYLLAGDVVIGVRIEGESRAYPLHVLYVHEIINDTLAGTPIAVTYNWPSGAAAVFDRRIDGPIQGTAVFAHSGLLYNCNLLMYDRNQTRESADSPTFGGGNEILFSQLLGRPIAGSSSALESRLTFIPFEMVTWADWSTRYPETSVIDRNLSMYERYKDAAPTPYFRKPEPLTPVSPLPSDRLDLKTPVIAVISPEARRVYPIPFVLDHAKPVDDESGLVEWRDTLDGRVLRFVGDRSAKTLRVESEIHDSEVLAIPSFWFAWHAMHPEDELFNPE